MVYIPVLYLPYTILYYPVLYPVLYPILVYTADVTGVLTGPGVESSGYQRCLGERRVILESVSFLRYSEIFNLV